MAFSEHQTSSLMSSRLRDVRMPMPIVLGGIVEVFARCIEIPGTPGRSVAGSKMRNWESLAGRGRAPWGHVELPECLSCTNEASGSDRSTQAMSSSIAFHRLLVGAAVFVAGQMRKKRHRLLMLIIETKSFFTI